MPVTCKLKEGKWRVVEPGGKIAKNDKGTAVDGGGHETKTQCQRQAKAINANSEDRKMEEENKNSAPINACIFEQDCCEVRFAEASDQVTEDRFSIIAYSGGIIPNHWFWGNIAFDLSGTRFDKKKTPVLEEHFTANRIGFTTKQEVTDDVRVEGRFLSNPKAAELRNDIKDGFPMQASLFIQPENIEHVKEGEKTEVNGRQLKGPGTVFRKARIKEVSMCAFGADSNTQSKAFAGGGKRVIDFNVNSKETIMEKENRPELSAETFAADYPQLHKELVEQARAGGVESERARFKEITDVCGDDHELAATLFVEGADLNSALSAKNAKLTEANRQLTEQMAEKAEENKEAVDPAKAEFSDDAAKQKAEKKDTKPKTDEERFAEEFNSDAKIQAEFGGAGGLADYIAFRRADEKGLVSIAGRR